MVGKTAAFLCSGLSRWVWDCVVQRFWTVKKTIKPRTEMSRYPEGVLTSSCHQLTVPLPLNLTAPGINTTSLQMWSKSRLQLSCTSKSLAGELTERDAIWNKWNGNEFVACVTPTYESRNFSYVAAVSVCLSCFTLQISFCL